MAYTIKYSNGTSIFTADNLGTVLGESSYKTSQLFQMPIPTKDSDKAFMIDVFGASRTIKIKGVFGPDTVANVLIFIQQLDSLINGMQNTKKYHSDKGAGSDGAGNYIVLVNSVNWNSEEGAPNKVDYEIEMIEGSA